MLAFGAELSFPFCKERLAIKLEDTLHETHEQQVRERGP